MHTTRPGSTAPPAYLSPIPKIWRIAEGLALVVLYIISVGWGDFGTTRPMISDTMLFGSHLFAAVEDITLNCRPIAIVHGEVRRLSECAQVYRSLLLAFVCVAADMAATVTQSKHVADDDDDSLYASLAFFSALILLSAIGRVVWFTMQWSRLPSTSAPSYDPVASSDSLVPLSTRRSRPTLSYDDMAGVNVTSRA